VGELKRFDDNISVDQKDIDTGNGDDTILFVLFLDELDLRYM